MIYCCWIVTIRFREPFKILNQALNYVAPMKPGKRYLSKKLRLREEKVEIGFAGEG